MDIDAEDVNHLQDVEPGFEVGLKMLQYVYDKQISIREILTQTVFWNEFQMNNVEILDTRFELRTKFCLHILKNLPLFIVRLTDYQKKYFNEWIDQAKLLTPEVLDDMMTRDGEDYMTVSDPNVLHKIMTTKSDFETSSKPILIESHAIQTTSIADLFKMPLSLKIMFYSFLRSDDEMINNVELSDNEIRKRLHEYISIHKRIPSSTEMEHQMSANSILFSGNSTMGRFHSTPIPSSFSKNRSQLDSYILNTDSSSRQRKRKLSTIKRLETQIQRENQKDPHSHSAFRSREELRMEIRKKEFRSTRLQKEKGSDGKSNTLGHLKKKILFPTKKQ